MNQWEWKERRFEVMCVRDGWAGVWDAVRALWTGKRYIVAKPMTVGLWVKLKDGGHMDIAQFTLGGDDYTHMKLG